MARDPGSVWAPLPEAGAPDGYTKDKFIFHSTGDRASAAAIRRYFERGDVVVESTFIVGTGPDDPTLQVMDSTDNADANMDANQSGIAVEVVGTGDDPFTDWQVSECIRLGIWGAENHPIQRRVVPSPTASGFGWHVMFGAPGPWTTVRGKVCPGSTRIRQLQNDIFPAIFAGHASEEDELMGAREDILAAIRAEGDRTRTLVDDGVIARLTKLYNPARLVKAGGKVWLWAGGGFRELGPSRLKAARADGITEIELSDLTFGELRKALGDEPAPPPAA